MTSGELGTERGLNVPRAARTVIQGVLVAVAISVSVHDCRDMKDQPIINFNRYRH